jgi:proteasome lid subunit RPN8/RPN11
MYFCHAGPTEIGGFGVSAADDLLYIEDFVTVRQTTTSVTVAFDDVAVADFYEDQVDQGRTPEQFSRVWLHTHPGDSATPSSVDEDTFARVFGGCDWAIMAILARGGQSYARLRFNVGPGGNLLIPIEVDYTRPFSASDQTAWQAEYAANVQPDLRWTAPLRSRRSGRSKLLESPDEPIDVPWDASDLLDALAMGHPLDESVE